jgi:hypothetical protein
MRVLQLFRSYCDLLQVELLGDRTRRTQDTFSSTHTYRVALEPSQYAVPRVVCLILGVKAAGAGR